MYKHPAITALIIFVGGVVIAIGILAAIDRREREVDAQWKQFYVDHKCKLVAQAARGYLRQAWLCEDGVTYWR